MQAGSGASSSSSPRKSVLLHVVLLCVCACSSNKDSHPPNRRPLAHTHHRLGRSYSSNRFFRFFYAIPLLASEAFLFIIPIYHHRFARELSIFVFPFSVSRETTGS